MRELIKKQGFCSQQKPCFWRTGWDSNPRAGVTDKLISSQSRYDHFDTRPYIIFSQSTEKTQSLSELDNESIISNLAKIVNRLIVNISLNADFSVFPLCRQPLQSKGFVTFLTAYAFFSFLKQLPCPILSDISIFCEYKGQSVKIARNCFLLIAHRKFQTSKDTWKTAAY